MASLKSNDMKPQNKREIATLNALVNLFGRVLDEDIIKSVALNCGWQLDLASNILAEISNTVNNDDNPSSNINSVAYAKTGYDNEDVDVLIEEDNEANNPKKSLSKIVNYEPEKQLTTSTKKTKRSNTPTGRNIPATKNNNNNTNKVVPPLMQQKSKRELEYERVKSHILTGAKVLILLRGLPGSGKSHLAQMIIRTTIDEDPRRFIYSTDEFFMRNGMYHFNPILLQDAHGWNQRRVYEAMHLGISPIIVDNTNTQMWELRPYVGFAIQFGYAVEVLEPMTTWLFNPHDLARRNIHQVPKAKIAEMLERYEKKITPERLFSIYGLRYEPNNHPPQPRLYPPMSKNIRPLFDIPVAIARNPIVSKPAEVAPLAATAAAAAATTTTTTTLAAATTAAAAEAAAAVAVVKAERKKRNKKKKAAAAVQKDGTNTINKSESMHSILTNESSDSDVDSLFDMENLSLESFQERQNLIPTKADSDEYVLIKPDKTIMFKNNHHIKNNTDLINFDCDVTGSKDTFSSDLISLGSNKERALDRAKITETTAQLIQSCVNIYKSVKANSDSKPEAKSIIEKEQPALGIYPKLDLSSWGLTDDALISWEVLDKPKTTTPKYVTPQPQRELLRSEEPIAVQTTDVSTITTGSDFNLLKQTFGEVDGANILPTFSRNINENFVNIMPRHPRKVAMFDKSTTTMKDGTVVAALSQNRCRNEDQHFAELLYLFPNTSNDDLREIFDKCQGDVNWAVDLLLDANSEALFTTKQQKLIDDSKITDHVHTSDCSCVADYENQPYTLPEPVLTSQSVEKTRNNETELLKSSPKPKSVVSPETLELKRLLEEQFKIGDTHYSKHLLNIRKIRHGETDQPTSKEEVEAIASVAADESECEYDDSSEEEMIEMNVGANFVEQLEQTVGVGELDYPKGFQPVIQLPASLVRQLHAYWLESVFQQMEAQSIVLDKMLLEDEEFARKLQAKEANAVEKQNPVVPNLQEIMDLEIALAIYRTDQEQWKNETPDDLASRMKRQKLFETFPTLDQSALVEILQAHGNSFDGTVEVLLESVGPDQMKLENSRSELAKQKELIENAKKEYTKVKQSQAASPIKVITTTQGRDSIDSLSSEKSAAYYREQAAHHLKMRQECFEKAHTAIQKGSTEIATYYSEIAKMHKQKFEQANSFAATAFLSTHSLHQNSQTLDLHYLHVKEAEEALAMFLDNQISKLHASRKIKEPLFIITGRGKHSPGGVSHIKPAIKRRLKDRNLEFVEMNPGLLKIVIYKHSIMTNDMEKH